MVGRILGAEAEMHNGVRTGDGGGSSFGMPATGMVVMAPEATVGDREQMEVSLTTESTGAERTSMENLVGNVFMLMLTTFRQGSV